MRRKSERTKKAKASPEKSEKSKKGRTSRRRKASSSSEDESGDEASSQVNEQPAEVENVETKCTDTPLSDDKVWQVKSDDSSGTGEIKKIKICLSTRLPSTPEPENTPRSRRKLNRTASDTPSVQSVGSEEKRKSRHKSRRSARESREGVAQETQSEDDDKVTTTVSQIMSEDSVITEASEECVENNASQKAESQEIIPLINQETEPKKVINERGDADSRIKNDDKRRKSLLCTPVSKRRRSRRLSGSSPERDSSPEQTEPVLLPQISEEPEIKQPVELGVQGSEELKEQRPNEPEIQLPEEPNVQPEEPKAKRPEEPKDESEHKESELDVKSADECEKVDNADHHANNDTNPSVQKMMVEQEVTLNSTDEPQQSDKIEGAIQLNAEQEKEIEQSKDSSPQQSTPECESQTDVHKKNTSEEINSTQVSKASEVHTPDSESDEVFLSNKSNVEPQSKVVEKEEKINSITSDKDCDVKKEEDPHRRNEARKSTDEPEETYNVTPIVVSRKRRWGSRVTKTSQSKPVSISTDVLKDIIPDVKPAELEEAIEEKHQRNVKEPVEKSKPERPFLPKIVIDNTENANSYRREKEREKKEKDRERERAHDNHMSEHRKISIIKDNNFTARPPSPARNHTSPVLYITNLVRPFTLAQLKNLLQRTGKIITEGFWIDRIKSKCFVTYENEEQAIETRHALHGVTWPVSNPKTLQVDFSSPEALEKMRSAEEQNDKPSVVPGTVEDWLREQDAKRERGEAEEPKPWDRKHITREWDVGKNEKERDKLKREERPLEKRRHRSAERSPEPARKFKKKEEEAPAKMLDDLFRKTKTVPCIYWLPLSAETIAVKEEQRRQHMAEHERRLQELERSRAAHRRH